ncbi:Uncharacterized protein QTN25_003224 [Entamoeba marina]
MDYPVNVTVEEFVQFKLKEQKNEFLNESVLELKKENGRLLNEINELQQRINKTPESYSEIGQRNVLMIDELQKKYLDKAEEVETIKIENVKLTSELKMANRLPGVKDKPITYDTSDFIDNISNVAVKIEQPTTGQKKPKKPEGDIPSLLNWEQPILAKTTENETIKKRKRKRKNATRELESEHSDTIEEDLNSSVLSNTLELSTGDLSKSEKEIIFNVKYEVVIDILKQLYKENKFIEIQKKKASVKASIVFDLYQKKCDLHLYDKFHGSEKKYNMSRSLLRQFNTCLLRIESARVKSGLDRKIHIFRTNNSMIQYLGEY